MTPILQRGLVFVTGKGGVGKTFVAAALGLAAARDGARAIVVEVGDHGRLPELFGVPDAEPGVETELRHGLASITVDPDRVLLEWVQKLGGRIPGKVLASSGTFQYFAAAAPGAKELFAMVKVWELTQGRRWQRRATPYDVVVLDAPATGHALGMLASPRTFGAIARVGPVASQAERVHELLADAGRSGYVGVALPTEMAVTEAIEIEQGLHEQLGRGLDEVVVNQVLPRRFDAGEMRRIATLQERQDDELLLAAARAARSVHERARSQHNQLARLRRRGFDVVGIPFAWGGELGLDALTAISARLARRLARADSRGAD